MKNGICRLFNTLLVALLSTSVVVSAEPFPQNPQEPAQTEPARPADDTQQSPSNSSSMGNSTSAPSSELPDAPTPAPAVQQKQDDSAGQAQNPSTVPSGAAGAKAAPTKGAPASRPVGSAIAPAKQRERRSLLIKVGLVAGACVAVGSAIALSKGSPSKPPGAP
jgi:hypothetical protein